MENEIEGKNPSFDELFEQAKKHAGVNELLELQSRYEEYMKKHNIVFRTNYQGIITTNSTS